MTTTGEPTEDDGMAETTTFRVTRTSDWSGENAPCPGAYRGRRVVPGIEAGGAYRLAEREVWLLDVPDLAALLEVVKDLGQVIIRKAVNGWEIEVYDYYRE